MDYQYCSPHNLALARQCKVFGMPNLQPATCMKEESIETQDDYARRVNFKFTKKCSPFKGQRTRSRGGLLKKRSFQLEILL